MSPDRPPSELDAPSTSEAPGAAPADDHDRCRCGLAMPVASSDLLQGRKSLEIRHEGMLYRLQVTRAGKLILTK